MPPGVVAVSAVVGPRRIAVGIVVVWLPLEIAVSPEILVGPLETAFVIAFGASNRGQYHLWRCGKYDDQIFDPRSPVLLDYMHHFIILFIFTILSNIHNAFRLTDCQIRNQIQYAIGGVEQ